MVLLFGIPSRLLRAVIHESSAVIGPVDDKFAQTTLQLVSEGSSGSVLLGRSAHVRVRRESRKSQCKHSAPSTDNRRPHP